WYCKEKSTTLAELAFKPDPPAVHLDELFRQGETQAGTLRFSGVASGLLKLEKDPFLILRSDARSRIAYFDPHPSILRVRLHPHPSAFGRELDRVSDQIQQNLLDPGTVHGKWL